MLITKLDEEKRLAFGWAYIAKDKFGNVVVDKQGDFVDDMEELEKAAYLFVNESRTGGVMHLRDGDNAKRIGHLVESFVTTPEKLEKMGLPSTTEQGWWVGFRVEDDEVWQGIKDGKYKSFSIHGQGRRQYMSKRDAIRKEFTG